MTDDAWLRLLARLAEGAPRPDEPIAEMRIGLEKAAAHMPLPENVTVEPIAIVDMAGEWIRPTDARADRVVLYLHGGGYVAGSLATHRALAAQLAISTASDVVTVDYALAPEAVFPRALRDAADAYQWLQLTRPDAEIVIAGDSAGAGLAVATAVAIRDDGGRAPQAVVCFSPWSDLSLPGDSVDANEASDPLVSRELLHGWSQLYLAGANPLDPQASPVYADLRGLPPMLIQAGGGECLLDDARALAAAAERDGVDTTFQCWDDMFHVWHALAPRLPQAVRALAAVDTWLRAHGE